MARISSKKTSPAQTKVFLHGILAPGAALACLLLLSLATLFLLPSHSEDLGPKWAETATPRSTGEAKKSLRLVESTNSSDSEESLKTSHSPVTVHEPREALPQSGNSNSPLVSARATLEAIMSGRQGREAQLKALEELSANESEGHAAIRQPLAHAYLALGERDLALREIESALSSNSQEAPAQLYEDASQLYFEKGSYEEALAHIDQALARRGSSGEGGDEFFTLVKKLQILGELDRREELESVLQELSARVQPGQEKILIDLKNRYNS